VNLPVGILTERWKLRLHTQEAPELLLVLPKVMVVHIEDPVRPRLMEVVVEKLLKTDAVNVLLRVLLAVLLDGLRVLDADIPPMLDSPGTGCGLGVFRPGIDKDDPSKVRIWVDSLPELLTLWKAKLPGRIPVMDMVGMAMMPETIGQYSGAASAIGADVETWLFGHRYQWRDTYWQSTSSPELLLLFFQSNSRN